ncbi:MAG TPA: outer membrane protein assembly factor BamB [Gammaproteobacteria bacterium]
MIRRFILILLLATIAACSSEKDNSEPPAELVEFEPTIQVNKLWDLSTGDGVQQQYLKLYPLILDDRIIVADREGSITAVNIETGKRIWKVDLDLILSAGVGGNAEQYYVATKDGEIVALNNEGKIVWRNQISSEVLVPPEPVDDRVIVRSVDGQIVALSNNTGKQDWNYQREVPALSLRGNSRLIISYGRIYSGLDNGRLVVLDATDGKTLLDVAVAVPTGRSELERIVDIDGDAVLDNGVLYMASYQGRVVAIDIRRGQLVWTRKLSTSTGIDVSTNSMFVADDRDHIWALDRNNGATLWKQDKLMARQVTRPAVMDDLVVTGDFEGYLHFMSQFDGHFVARVELDDSGILVPPMTRDDKVFAISRDGRLAAYRVSKRAD